jgi:hypothetical protein
VFTNGLATLRAALEEARGNLEEAAMHYEEVAQGWKRFGAHLEVAYANWGLGRCLIALGNAAGAQPLAEARETFARLRAEPTVQEIDGVLAGMASERASS